MCGQQHVMCGDRIRPVAIDIGVDVCPNSIFRADTRPAQGDTGRPAATDGNRTGERSGIDCLFRDRIEQHVSGGGNIVISVGKESLIGANAGIGIPLGDRCKVESGLYITAGTKVVVLDDAGNEVKTLKARELAGVSDLVFRRNSITGRVEVVTNKSALQLNTALHAN